MKIFRCVPIVIGLPAIFLAYLFISVFIAVSCGLEGDTGGMILFLVFAVLALGLAAYTVVPGIQRVEIGPESIVCKGLPGQSFQMRYRDCQVGMDYHVQNDGKSGGSFCTRAGCPYIGKTIPPIGSIPFESGRDLSESYTRMKRLMR